MVPPNCTWPETSSSPGPLVSCASTVGGLEVCSGTCPQAPALVVGQSVAHFLQISGVSTLHSLLHGKFLKRKLFCLLLSWSGA